MINISKYIRNVCKRKIPLCSFIILTMILILIMCPFINIFHPSNIDINNVNRDDLYVNVKSDTLYYTGYDLIKAGTKNYGYYYSLHKGKCTFVIIPIEETPKQIIKNYKFKAKIIKSNRSYNKMLSAFSADLDWNDKDLLKVTNGFILSSADYHPARYMILLWFVLVVLFIASKKFLGAVCSFINTDLYPVCTFLGRHEQKSLIEKAQADLSSQNFLQINSMYITENFFIDFGRSKVSIIPLDRILWCYRLGSISLNLKKHQPKYSLHFTILSGAVITARHKSSDEALEAINAIRAADKDIIIGHSESKRRRAKRKIYLYRKNS